MKKLLRLCAVFTISIMLFSVCGITAFAEDFVSYEENLSEYSDGIQEELNAMLKSGVADTDTIIRANKYVHKLLNEVNAGDYEDKPEKLRKIITDITVIYDNIDISSLSFNSESRENDISTINDARNVLDTLISHISFDDVESSDWFCKELQSATAHGLINGIGDNLFEPQGALTAATAVKLAASARAYCDGDLNSLSVYDGDGHWAANYVDYAVSKGILNEVPDLDKVITRDEMAKIFAAALPVDAYEVINDASSMPEQGVPDYVEQLFKAGILIGDITGFRLSDNITRAETACIINRIIFSGQRQLSENKTEATAVISNNDFLIENVLSILGADEAELSKKFVADANGEFTNIIYDGMPIKIELEFENSQLLRVQYNFGANTDEAFKFADEAQKIFEQRWGESDTYETLPNRIKGLTVDKYLSSDILQYKEYWIDTDVDFSGIIPREYENTKRVDLGIGVNKIPTDEVTTVVYIGGIINSINTTKLPN